MRTFFCALLAIALIVGSSVPIAADTQAAGAASPSASPTSGSFLPVNYTSKHILYVLAIGGDAPTRQKFVASLTQGMQYIQWQYLTQSTSQGDDFQVLAATTTFIPEPDWGIADYTSACVAKYSPTPDYKPTIPDGALIVGIDQISSYTDSHFFSRTNRNIIHATLFYSRCDAAKSNSGDDSSDSKGSASAPRSQCSTPLPNDTTSPFQVSCRRIRTMVTGSDVDKIISNWSIPTPPPKAKTTPPYYLQWQTGVSTEQGATPVLTLLPAVGLLLSLVSGYTALAPTRSSTSATTTIFATPLPWRPPPPNGYVSGSVQTNVSAVNESQFGAVASGFLAGSINYNSNLTSIPVGDQESLLAVKKVTYDFYKSMGCSPLPSPPPVHNRGESFAPEPAEEPCARILMSKPVRSIDVPPSSSPQPPW